MGSRKKSKIKEKPGRIGNLFESSYTNKIKKYIEDIKQQHGETAKSQRFLMLLKDLFQDIDADFINKYLSGTEKYVSIKDKDICVKGRVDAFYGNLIIEFEKDLNKKLQEAQTQLKRYSFTLYKNGTLKNPLAIATDGLNFVVYLPLLEKANNPDEVELKEIEKINFAEEKPEDIHLWLDRYFMRQSPKTPTTEEIKNDFGLKSPLYKYIFHNLYDLWNQNKNQNEFKIIFDNWEKYIGIVYGSKIGSHELFIRHTYLATLAKLMIWKRFSDGSFREKEIAEVLKGEYFSKRMGILNFLEEDFFSWIVRKNVINKSIELSKLILYHLGTFNLRELKEDIFKSLYQELVDPETRHDLGEFYTPDWLAEKMVHRVLEDNIEKSIIDPACGSGTFLYMAIKTKKDVFKKEKSKSDSYVLNHILENVMGIDVHPLAVIIAKANYLLALGDLIKKARKEIKIPVYLANSIDLIEEKEVGMFETIHIKILPKKDVELPVQIVKDSSIYDLTLETIDRYAREYAGKEENQEVFKKFIKRKAKKILKTSANINTLYKLAKILKELIEQRKDTIWTFILKNLYKPVFLKEKFDVVIGNPPWLSFRYIKDSETQKKLKEEITKVFKLLDSKRPELITHLEIGTYFFVKTANYYLKQNGIIAFVLPRSIFSGDQHHNFRKGNEHIPQFYEIWDLEKVKPLFNVPSCVIFARKKPPLLEKEPISSGSPLEKGDKGGLKTFSQHNYPIKALQISGVLDSRNADLETAQEKLEFKEKEIFLNTVGNSSFLSYKKEKDIFITDTYYKENFKQGATLVPRAFWFIELKTGEGLRFNPERPYVITSSNIDTKKPWDKIKIEGNIEKEFLYVTLLSSDIFPFGHADFRPIVLPVIKEHGNFKIVTKESARAEGFTDLADWLEKCEELWERDKKESIKESIYQWLNYRNKLTEQKRKRYTVLYPTSATYLCGCVVESQNIKFRTGDIEIKKIDFIVDYTSYYFDTDNLKEAYYIASILNSCVLDKFIKEKQARGLFGPRHIVKKIFDFPFPKFNPQHPKHLELAEIGKECTQKVKRLLPALLQKYRNTGKIRSIIRKELEKEIKKIDKMEWWK